MAELGDLTPGVDDPRWLELAQLLVSWSSDVRPNENVLITISELEAFPLARAVHAAVVRIGAVPHVELQSATLERDLVTIGTPVQAGTVPELLRSAMRWADVCVVVRVGSDAEDMEAAPVASLAARVHALGVISGLRTQSTRWVIVRIPGRRHAERAQVSLSQMTSTFLAASLQDWRREGGRCRQLAARFDGTQEVRITGPGTDLRLGIAGRTWEIDDGHINVPGGEIFTSPIEDSADGFIEFEHAAVFAGRAIGGIRLRFRGGEVTDASADTNEDLLHRLLATDEGARRIGEFGLGTNRALTRMCGDPLLDEKIAGTVHIALGRSYAVCGGHNESALHWDITKDLRSVGHVLADGREISQP